MHVRSALIYRLLLVILAGGNVLFITLCLSKSDQGLYFTLLSFLSLQTLFDSGLATVILNAAAHEAPKSDLAASRAAPAQTRRASLLRYCQRRGRFTAAAFFAVSSLCIVLYFHSGSPEVRRTAEWAWLVLGPATACNLYLSFQLSCLEGFGNIDRVYNARSIALVASSVAGYIGLLAGLGVLSIALPPAVTVLFLLYNVEILGRPYAWKEGDRTVLAAHLQEWEKDLSSFRRRTAISWISGFVIFNLITPIAFKFINAEEAGRIGITIQVLSGILSVSLAPVVANTARFGSFLSAWRADELHDAFTRALKKAAALYCLGVLGVVVVYQFLPGGLRDRFAGGEVFAFLLLNTTCNLFVMAFAVYLRAHKEEPLVMVSVMSAGLMLLGFGYFVLFPPVRVVEVTAVVTAVVTFPLTWRLFRTRYALNKAAAHEKPKC